MTRVLQAIRTVDSRQTGGAEELLLMMSPRLIKRGRYDQAILLLRSPDPTADPAKDFGNRARALDVPVVAPQDIRWRPGPLRNLPRKLGVDLIHMHGQRANYFIWLMRRLFPGTWGRVPLVATVHGWVQDNFVRKVVTWLEFQTLRECDFVITVSEQQRETLLSKGFKAGKVGVVRPGIPYLENEAGHEPTAAERAAARAKWALPEEAFVVTAVGRLSTEKRFDLYLQVCAELAAKLPEARFMLVGGGKQEAALREIAASLGLNDKLTFTGLTRDMPAVYAATDLLMLTSDTEGTPHVLLEAMGSGIPVVATAVGGIPEFITSGEHGILAKAGDKDALADAVLRLRRDPALLSRVVAGGRQVAAQFTVERMAQGVERVYDTVLSRKAKTP